jgi:hypothetical protein
MARPASGGNGEPAAPPHPRGGWLALAAVEVVAVAFVVLFDVAEPTLVIVPMAGVSLLVRRQRFGSLGFCRPLRANSSSRCWSSRLVGRSSN